VVEAEHGRAHNGVVAPALGLDARHGCCQRQRQRSGGVATSGEERDVLLKTGAAVPGRARRPQNSPRRSVAMAVAVPAVVRVEDETSVGRSYSAKQALVPGLGAVRQGLVSKSFTPRPDEVALRSLTLKFANLARATREDVVAYFENTWCVAPSTARAGSESRTNPAAAAPPSCVFPTPAARSLANVCAACRLRLRSRCRWRAFAARRARSHRPRRPPVPRSPRALTNTLFAALRNDSVFYMMPDRLRRPLIFYFGHPAALYVNKLQVAGLCGAWADAAADVSLVCARARERGTTRVRTQEAARARAPRSVRRVRRAHCPVRVEARQPGDVTPAARGRLSAQTT
jgi:hypothetical protein